MKSWRVGVCLLGLVFSVVRAEAARSTPNVIVIVIYTDDRGCGDANLLNPVAKFQTPKIDQLAREGGAFADAHGADAQWTPSRYSFLTGRSSWGMVLKQGLLGAGCTGLIEDGRRTLTSLLRQWRSHGDGRQVASRGGLPRRAGRLRFDPTRDRHVARKTGGGALLRERCPDRITQRGRWVPTVLAKLEERITAVVVNGRVNSGAIQSNDPACWVDLT